jgi:RNA polymerase sigma-70 factor, ECF subfamily
MTFPEANAGLCALIQRIGVADQAALASLYQKTSAQLFALLLRMLKRRDLAEEALQDVFVAVWRKAASFRPERGPAMAWLIGMTRNRAIDIQRRSRREVSLEQQTESAGTEIAVSDSDPMTEALAALDSRRLEDCLGRLNENQRRGIRLAYLEGLTQEEIAASLASPLGTVKSWIRRGLLALKECLQS